LQVAGASRRVSLVFRSSFPRRAALEALVKVILASLPNTVKPESGTGKVKARARKKA
jgi:LysR family hydrogen peroxide-inducible transcriptional activator